MDEFNEDDINEFNRMLNEQPDGGTTTPPDHLFAAIESFSAAVATFTGIKQKFVDSGWNPDNAERMLIALMNKGVIS